MTTRFDGTGFSCTVGGRTVVCVHGNERDDWNLMDHAPLRRWIRDVNVRRTPTPFAPNARTRLVIDVMNPIKRGLPFVDLLKPEDEAVPNVLASLGKERRGLGVGAAAKQAVRILWHVERTADFREVPGQPALRVGVEFVAHATRFARIDPNGKVFG